MWIFRIFDHLIAFNGEIYNHPEMRAELGRMDYFGHREAEGRGDPSLTRQGMDCRAALSMNRLSLRTQCGNP